MNKISNYIKDSIVEIKECPLYLKPFVISAIAFIILFIPYFVTLFTGVYINVLTIGCILSYAIAIISGIIASVIELRNGKSGMECR